MLKNLKKLSILAVVVFAITVFYCSYVIYGLAQTDENGAITSSGDQDSYAINKEVSDINNQIQNTKNKMKSIQDKQKAYEDAITAKQQERSSLNNELAILDNRIAKSELDIESVQTDIDRVNLEITKTNMEIDNKNTEIATEKNHIESILRLMHHEDQIDTFEILLLNNSLADFLTQTKYLEDIDKEVGESIKNLAKLKEQLEKTKLVLDQKSKNLDALKKDMNLKKQSFEFEKDNKGNLLLQVNSSEKEYQRLLAQAKKEQQDAANDISSLERSMRAKLAKLKDSKLDNNDAAFMWPVPRSVVTAYFHDPDYPFRNVFEHPAIDIKAKQSTPIKAAASGYIARAKDGGAKGYSYIMIVHGDELSTVYGHVSQILVKEDDYVVQGQVIGMSGGTPGTHGAGGLTTGAHLHFEVRKNGIPVDPLGYLP